MARNRYFSLNELADLKTPCVFISHQQRDKEIAKKIADYFLSAGVDVYFDEYDKSIEIGNPQSVVDAITRGLSRSTHLLCILTDNAMNSMWVPWEIGYAYCQKHNIVSLTDKTWSVKNIPEYLEITKIVRGTESLNNFILNLRGINESQMKREVRYFSANEPYHPLNNYLNKYL